MEKNLRLESLLADRCALKGLLCPKASSPGLQASSPGDDVSSGLQDAPHPALTLGPKGKSAHQFIGKESSPTSSKTSFNLYWVSAEHSTYLIAPKSLAILSPSSLRTGCIRCLASFSRTCGSSRRSVCVPTMRQGTPGQWWCTSGNHFSLTFSNEAGDVPLNPSVGGIDSVDDHSPFDPQYQTGRECTIRRRF